ncbi:hypothetical protein C8R47DRAFT_1140135 [Mycena vitilis]|nr:hypothetical protein C8R47DRAFT_1140135 [Mycena vitilis]
MASQRAFLCCTIYVCVLIACAGSVSDFPQCFAEIKNGESNGTTGGTNNQGEPVDDIRQATSITHELCKRACGSGAGLQLTILGLARYNWDNLIPCLAAYSLALTVLNTGWLTRRFAHSTYPNSAHAALILSSLQQNPLKVTTEGSLLASLVVLPENDPWWKELAEWLDYADIHTWTIAAVTSVAWVVIAYALTIIDAFSTISTDPNSNGQGLSGVGSIWLWMLSITIGYLQISPRPNGAVNADTVNKLRALSFHTYRGSLYSDQDAAGPPIYNYARLFSFVQVVEEFVAAFRYATENSKAHKPVDSSAQWVAADGKTIHPANRSGTVAQVEAFVALRLIFLIASLAALALQWSTSGASVLIVYFTPTVGSGCRSGAYLLYAAVATLIWWLLVVSSALTHYATIYPEYPDVSQRAAAYAAISPRRVAKFLATCNAAWIISAFLLQFGNFYDRCYCNSDVLGLGKRAHNVMLLEGPDISAMKAAWIGGVILAVVVSSLFLGFINVFIDPPLPP